MSIRLNAATLLAVSLLFVSCSNTSSESAQSTNYTSVDSTAYAEGFRLTSGPEGIRLLTISDPQHSGTEVYRYALVPKGHDID
ncbi:MAG: iron ABC transporter substrate-binding protein, partial [Paramuribaculum sp.]|nr:iron ABC transporter substrate-binding protein [Paramuribaculum sp.]